MSNKNPLDAQYNQSLKKYMTLIDQNLTQPKKSRKLVQATLEEIITSAQCHNWKILDEILKRLKLIKFQESSSISQHSSFPYSYSHSVYSSYLSRSSQSQSLSSFLISALQKTHSLPTLLYLYKYLSTDPSSPISPSILNLRTSRQYRQLFPSVSPLSPSFSLSQQQPLSCTLLCSYLEISPSDLIIQQTIQMLTIYANFCKQNYIKLGEREIGMVVQWVLYGRNGIQYDSMAGLIGLVREGNIGFGDIAGEGGRDMFVLKRIVDVCNKIATNAYNANPNCLPPILSPSTPLLLHPPSLPTKNIPFFIHLHNDLLLSLSPISLLSIFLTLTQSPTLLPFHFFLCLTNFLKQNEQFYKLKILYEKFVLPVLARRMKWVKGREEIVFEICWEYVTGMSQFGRIGEKGVECLVRGLAKIGGKAKEGEGNVVKGMKGKWIGLLGLLVESQQEYRPWVEKWLEKEFLNQKIELPKGLLKMLPANPSPIWYITQRNSKNLKFYPKFLSSLKGIKNNHNGISIAILECYIISIVQALARSEQFLNLFLTYSKQIASQLRKGKCKILNELIVLMQQVSARRQSKQIVVGYLKKCGPAQFRQSISQQDAYHYLVRLLQQLQLQFSSLSEAPIPTSSSSSSSASMPHPSLEHFHSLLHSPITTTISCPLCHSHQSQSQQSLTFSISHTVPSTSALTDKSQQILSDFLCENCQKRGQCVLQRQIRLKGKIVIVQINRFSHHDGKPRKQLKTPKIEREIGGGQYRIEGMVCHWGKNIQHGHYIYYWRYRGIDKEKDKRFNKSNNGGFNAKIKQQVNEKLMDQSNGSHKSVKENEKQKWIIFNDNLVEQFYLDKQNEQFELEWKLDMTPFILFYRKKDF